MSYKQPPHLEDKEIQDFFQTAKIARLCTFNKNGTIHAVPVWFKYENNQFTIAAPEKSQKVRNILRNNNVTLLVDVEGPPTRGVIVYGEAEVNFDKWDEEAVDLLSRYFSREQAEKTMKGVQTLTNWIKITITPNRFASFDYEKDDKYWKAAGYSPGRS
ncbi:MAG: pyridoxamine 5'-phosphate oxidase family protein [Promethearchaeota archaeon]